MTRSVDHDFSILQQCFQVTNLRMISKVADDLRLTNGIDGGKLVSDYSSFCPGETPSPVGAPPKSIGTYNGFRPR